MNKKIIWGIVIAVILVIIGLVVLTKSRSISCDDCNGGLYGGLRSSTSDWKTYSNTKDGYSISYPAKYHEAFGNDLLNYDENKYENGNSDGVKIQIAPQEMKSIPQVNEVLTIVYSGKVTTGPGGIFDVWNVFGKNEVLYFKINIWGYNNDRQTIEKILQTFKFTSPKTVSTTGPTPVINSISQSSGSKGITVEIKGQYLSGFEGDLQVIFERADGRKFLLTDDFGDYLKTGASLIKVVVKEPCQKGETVYGSYSGIASQCDYAEMTPGVYKVYAEPFGKKSNIVQFTLIANSNPPITLCPKGPSSSSETKDCPITVEAPKDGEVLKVGQSYKITWSGYFDRGDEEFSLNLLQKHNDVYSTIIKLTLSQASCKKGELFTCSYMWTPNSQVGNLTIQVFNNKNGNQYGSSGMFSITN